MNIVPQLVSEVEMRRINLLREVSLFKFYKTGVKSIYSYACHNVKDVWFSTLGWLTCTTTGWAWASWRKRTTCRWWRRVHIWVLMWRGNWMSSMSATIVSTSIPPTSSPPVNLFQIGRQCPRHLSFNPICTSIPVRKKLIQICKEEEFHRDLWPNIAIVSVDMQELMRNMFVAESFVNLA